MKHMIRPALAFSAIAALAHASSACQQGSTNDTEATSGNAAGSANALEPVNSSDQPAASNAAASAPSMSEEQRTAYMRRHGVGFAGTDTNSDGRVTMEEATAYARGPLTSGGDTDGDGAMSAAELARASPEVRAMLLRRDADGDGAVSSAEIDARVERTFRAADTDGDGGITEQEFQAAAAAAPAR